MNGTQIRYLMRLKGIGITELARRVGVKHSHISNILAGRKRPSIDLALRISDLFEVSVNDLMRGNADKAKCKGSPQELTKEAEQVGKPEIVEKMGGDEFD